MKWWLLAVLGALSCAKCGDTRAVDAGYGAGCGRCAEAFGTADAGFSARRSIDLRTALMFAYPENRGAHIIAGSALLTRHVRAKVDWHAEFEKTLAQGGFERLDAGAADEDAGIGLINAKRGTQHLDLVNVNGDVAELRTWVRLNDDLVGKVFGSPASISTQELALAFPHGGGLYVEDERFELEFVYQATSVARVSFMTKQVLELLERSGQWQFVGARPWEGDGGVSDDFTATIRNVSDESRLLLIRKDGRAQIKLTVDTLVR